MAKVRGFDKAPPSEDAIEAARKTAKVMAQLADANLTAARLGAYQLGGSQTEETMGVAELLDTAAGLGLGEPEYAAALQLDEEDRRLLASIAGENVSRHLTTRALKGEPERDGKKIKLSIEVTPELNRVIERIADATGATKSEAVRKAIVLLDVAVEAKENGERLFVGTEPPPGASREIVGL